MDPLDDVPLAYPVNVLVSYHYFNKADVGQMKRWGLRIIGDSGAFSAQSQNAPIDRDEFFAWARHWRDDLYWIASLDVIGDPEQSFLNWQAAPDDLRLIPTVHYGEDPSMMDRYVENGADLIGLGGMVPYKSEPQRLLRWCLSMMRYARDNHPHVRFHGWGVSHPTLMMNLPWWSVDSSGFSAAYRYGMLKLFDPVAHKRLNIPLNGVKVAKYAALLRDHYDVDWRRITTSHPGNRRDLVRVSIRSMQLLERYLQQRHKVTAPASLLQPEGGPQVHAAIGKPSAQAPTGLSPDDRGPAVHLPMGMPTSQPVYSVSPDDRGPQVVFVDAAPQNLAEAKMGPLVAAAHSTHIADFEILQETS